MTLTTKPALGIALLLLAPLAVAQSNLGQLLDAGAKRLSPEEFREEVVQRVLVGSMASETRIELIYASSGQISGRGANAAGPTTVELGGDWRIDESGKICSSMRVTGAGGASAALPARCQFWFKYKEDYFVSDSDWDRSAPVFRRTVRQ